MPIGVYPRKSLEERFWAKVDKHGPNGCWNWTAGEDGCGYGRIKVNGKMAYAHRVSWELTNGPIPEGMQVLHHCDNPSCVNPAHLFLGTVADNSRDMVSKERQARGEAHSQAKLTEQEVYEIRALLKAGYPQREIASAYDVDYRTINDIKTGKTWGWLA